MLTRLGAFKSVKKFADIWPEESEENAFDLYQTKAKNEEKDKILQKLYSEEEAAIFLELTHFPETSEQLASRLEKNHEELLISHSH